MQVKKETTYVDRMVTELEALTEKTANLAKFFHTDKFKSLNTRKRTLLYLQFEGMQLYQSSLTERIELEK